MKKLFAVLIIAFIATIGAACKAHQPKPGHEIVLTAYPAIFTNMGGVRQTPVATGTQYSAVTTQGVEVDMRPFSVVEHFDDLMAKNGVPLDFDSTIQMRVVDSVQLVTKFGIENWYKSNVQAQIRDAVRDEIKAHDMNETAIDATASTTIDTNVTAHLKEIFQAKFGNVIEMTDFTLGKANPPDAIKDQRTETATQEQRLNTEAVRKRAEEIRLAAEIARAAADNGYREAMRLNPDQFLTLEQIKVQAGFNAALKEICNGEKSKGCQFIYGGSGSGPVPVLPVR